jgi:hypothetical protein
MQFRPMRAELLYADGLTDRRTDKHQADSKTTWLKLVFCNYALASKNENCFLQKNLLLCC